MPGRNAVFAPISELLVNNPDKAFTLGTIAKELRIPSDRVKSAMYNARRRGTLDQMNIETVVDGLSWRYHTDAAEHVNGRRMLEELGPSKDGTRTVFQDENGGIWLAEQI